MSTIYWVGDSTVAYNDATTYPQTGMGQVFALYCNQNYNIVDLAKNGASSKSFYDAGRFEPVRNHIKEGDFLFVQFGHNDEKSKADRYTEPFTTYQEYLMRYVDTARKKGAHPLLITPLSRRLFKEDGTIEDSHMEYPAALIELAVREGIPYVDLTGRSKELLEKTGEKDSRKWFMYFPVGTYRNYEKDMTDNTHLHYEGAVEMDRLLAEELRKIGGVYGEILL